MKVIDRLAGLLVVAMLILLCGCSHVSTPVNSTPVDSAPSESSTPFVITVGKTTFTEDELCRQLENTVNAELYYSGTIYEHLLNRRLEYALYYKAPNYYWDKPKVGLVIENVPHPRSTESETLFPAFIICISEMGLESTFWGVDYITQGGINSVSENGWIFIGRHTMCFPTASTPSREIMSREWADAAEKALRLYMDKNDFYAEKEKNLPSGKYRIYIHGFTAADTDTFVFFEHEDGRVYGGYYYFVHEFSGEWPADLNHVERYLSYENADSQQYFERIKETAALVMEYAVE